MPPSVLLLLLLLMSSLFSALFFLQKPFFPLHYFSIHTLKAEVVVEGGSTSAPALLCMCRVLCALGYEKRPENSSREKDC